LLNFGGAEPERSQRVVERIELRLLRRAARSKPNALEPEPPEPPVCAEADVFEGAAIVVDVFVVR